MLFEILSGKRASETGTRIATMAAALNKESAQINVLLPKELERIVPRCLRSRI